MAISNAQLKFYFDVCNQKGVLPKDTSDLTPYQLRQIIDEIMKMPNKAYPDQISALKEVLGELVEGGVQGVRMPSDKFFQSLNYDTAKEWLNRARSMRTKHYHMLPPNEQQLERLAEMYLCPDIEWESISFENTETIETFDEDGCLTKRKVTTQESTFIQRKIYTDEEVNGKRLWRFMMPEEFKEELRNNLSHSQASYILDRYTGTFQAWRRTRLTLTQKDQIRRLENRLASIYTPKPVTVFDLDQPFDFDAPVDADVPFESKGKRIDNWNPNAYVPLQDHQLDMMSREEADAYILQLRRELQDPSLKNVGGAQELEYAEGVEEVRNVKNQAELRTKEYKELNNFLVALQEGVGIHFEHEGMTGESLRHDALQIFFNGSDERTREDLMNSIKDFMRMAIEKQSIRVTALMRLSERSYIAAELMDSIISEDPTYAVKLLKLQSKQF